MNTLDTQLKEFAKEIGAESIHVSLGTEGASHPDEVMDALRKHHANILYAEKLSPRQIDDADKKSRLEELSKVLVKIEEVDKSTLSPWVQQRLVDASKLIEMTLESAELLKDKHVKSQAGIIFQFGKHLTTDVHTKEELIALNAIASIEFAALVEGYIESRVELARSLGL